VLSLNSLVRWLRGCGFGSTTFGLALLGCANHEIVSELPWLPVWITPDKIAAVGFLLFLGGALAIAVAYSVRSLQRISALTDGVFLDIRMMAHDYQLLEMRVTDLPDIYPVYRTLFGNDLIPQSKVESWMRKNPRITWKVVRELRAHGVTRPGWRRCMWVTEPKIRVDLILG
jgi:hypothetical protein